MEKFKNKFKSGKKFLILMKINFIENKYFIEKENEFIQFLSYLEKMIEDNEELNNNWEKLDNKINEVIMIIFIFKWTKSILTFKTNIFNMKILIIRFILFSFNR